jgi:adenosine deaminase
MKTLIEQLPKAELHLHIEGTLEPEMMLSLAQRNNIQLPYQSVSEVKTKYEFHNLQSFLDIYYEAMHVLITEEDFYDLTLAYLKRASHQNIKIAEIFFDPQAHMIRGIPFDTVIKGIHRAIEEGKSKFNIYSGLIMCFLRDLTEKEAFNTLEKALGYKDWILGVGLDSAEKANPPSKFKDVFAEARRQGFKLVAHAGEEGPPEYIWQALEILQVARIDHGIRCLEDKKLVQRLIDQQIPLTVCPLSNVRLQVVHGMQNHPLKIMLEEGLCVTLNSDDPAYFGGYLNENFIAAQQALDLKEEQIKLLAKNSLTSSFLRK